MQGFIVVEAFAKFALKAFSKAFEVAGFDSFSRLGCQSGCVLLLFMT